MGGARIALLLCFLPLAAAAAELPQRRGELEVPGPVWDRVREGVDFEGRKVGYSAEQMAHFSGFPQQLATIENLFRDVTAVPRFSGRVSDRLLANADTFDAAVRTGYALLGARAGRGFEEPDSASWGLEMIPDTADADGALRLLLSPGGSGLDWTSTWSSLSYPVKRLAVRLVIAAMRADPLLRESWDSRFVTTGVMSDGEAWIRPDDRVEFLAAPWDGSADPVPRRSFEMVGEFDMGYMAYGSVAFARLARHALNEYRSSADAGRTAPAGFDRLVLTTPAGMVTILGPDADTVLTENGIFIDTGGDDTYRSGGFRFDGCAVRQVIVDLAGDDRYEAGQDTLQGHASGMLGVGALFDLAGDDRYESVRSGLGSGLYGTGLLVDYRGDDEYVTAEAWGQGAAHCGVGLLVDLEGNDRYTCATESQGFGGTLGTGMLLDLAGDDVYLARLDGRPSEPFGNRSVSLAQGAGFGRRADFGDGHSLAGGIGMLVDGDGDDSYTGGVYCQGTGYWWALGILEDRKGDDSYSNLWYSLGSAPHFAIGCCVDLEGDDRYNVGNDSMRTQTQACARDGSIGVFVDGNGDDEYFHRNRCAGAGDLNSIALFWDRAGRDRYRCDRNGSYAKDRSYGGAAEYERFRTFRDEIPTAGIFLDTGGEDVYEEIPAETQSEMSALQFGNNRTWFHGVGGLFRAVGVDTDWYESTAE